MKTLIEKEQAHKMIDRMPANVSWDDLYVRAMIERGLSDSMAGKTRDVKEVRDKHYYTTK